MGGYKDSTYLDVMKALSKQYPPHEGWEFAWKPTVGGVQPECMISRRNAGKIQRVLVGVKMAKAVPQTAIEDLVTQAENLADQNIPVTKAVLVAPAGADVPLVPEGIDIVRLDTYRVVGDRIAWAKNLERGEILEAERQRRGLE